MNMLRLEIENTLAWGWGSSNRMKTPLLNVVPDAVTTVTVGPNSGIIGDMVHDTAAAIGEERCIEEYLEHPITTFLMDGAGEPVIPLSDMPRQASFHLKALDRTKSGTITVSELQKAVEALQSERNHSKMLYTIIAFFFLFAALVAVSMAGVTWFIFKNASELKIENHMLKSTKNNEVVRVASTDFKVVEDRLISRACNEEFCTAIQASVGTFERQLSSTMSNVDLNSLEAVSVEGDTDEMVFVKIHAFSRFADAGSKHGTLLVLFTELGEITMDGEDISVSADASGAFEQAGFSLGASRRSIEHAGVRILGYFHVRGAQSTADTRSNDTEPDLWANMRRTQSFKQVSSASVSASR